MLKSDRSVRQNKIDKDLITLSVGDLINKDSDDYIEKVYKYIFAFASEIFFYLNKLPIMIRKYLFIYRRNLMRYKTARLY